MTVLPQKQKKSNKFLIVAFIIALIALLVLNWDYIESATGKKLTILHTNNFYSQIGPLKQQNDNKEVEVGGLDRIATKVKEIRKKSPNVLLLDAGDTTKGTLFTRVHGSKPIGRLMSELNYDAVVVGDDDFYNGPEGLTEYIHSTKHPFLGANLLSEKHKDLDDSVLPYIIKDVDGIKIGIMGLITTDAILYAKSGNDVKITDPIEAARQTVKELRPKCDFIIALTHLGIKEDRRLASTVPGINIIVGGHSETKLAVPIMVQNPEGFKTIIVQAKSLGRFLGKLDISVSNGKTLMSEYTLIPIDESIKPDPVFNKEINQLYKELNEEVNKTIGETRVDMDSMINHLRTRETNVGDLFTDSTREAFPEVDIVLQNSGGIREDEIVPAGKLTLADVWHWHPFQNKIVLLTLNGKQIKEVLERGACNLPTGMGNFLQVSGLTYTIDLTGTPQELTEDNSAIKITGNRIIDVKIHGKPLDETKEYRVAIPDFLAPGGDGFITFKQGKDIVYTDTYLTDVIINYIAKHSPLNINTDGRITVKGGLIH